MKQSIIRLTGVVLFIAVALIQCGGGGSETIKTLEAEMRKAGYDGSYHVEGDLVEPLIRRFDAAGALFYSDGLTSVAAVDLKTAEQVEAFEASVSIVLVQLLNGVSQPLGAQRITLDDGSEVTTAQNGSTLLLYTGQNTENLAEIFSTIE